MFHVRKLCYAGVLCALMCMAAVGEAHADTIVYSNFGPGMTSNTGIGYVVTGTNFFSGQVLAVRFTSTSNINFSSAQLAMLLINPSC